MSGRQTTPERQYRMAARAQATQANGERILAAAQELFAEQLYDQVSCDDVAAQAGVTVRTVMRRFGSKQQLFGAVAEERALTIRSSRREAPVGDVPGAVRNLVGSYEEWGDIVLHMLAQERRIAAVGEAVRAGRRYQQAWVTRVFSPLLGDLPPLVQRRRLAQLRTVTDIYAWKVLRRDLGLGRAEVELALRELISDIVARGT